MRAVLSGRSGRNEAAGTPLQVAGAGRGVAQGVLLSVVLSLAAYFSTGSTQDGSITVQALALGPLCAILCAARIRLRPGDRRTVLRGEAATGAIFAALASLPGALVVVAGAPVPQTVLAYPFLFVWNLGAFAFFRTLSYLWPRWAGLRRSRLRWELTHTILLVAASVAVILILALTVVCVFRGVGPAMFTTFLPAVGFVVSLTIVAVGLVLPPAALFSYYVARHAIRRLEDLVRGTSGLREGNFDVRVNVEGEDEISELHSDFNAMADGLGTAINELRSERDNVERLLKVQRELVASVSHELRTPGRHDARLPGVLP